MAAIFHNNKKFHVSEDGFLERFSEWNGDWIEYNLINSDINELTNKHRKVLSYLREYYIKFGVAPMVRVLTREVELTLKEIYELFPEGPSKGACKIAGLPKPNGCM